MFNLTIGLRNPVTLLVTPLLKSFRQDLNRHRDIC